MGNATAKVRRIHVRTEYSVEPGHWTALLPEQPTRVEASTLHLQFTPGWDVRVQSTNRSGVSLAEPDDWSVGLDLCGWLNSSQAPWRPTHAHPALGSGGLLRGRHLAGCRRDME